MRNAILMLLVVCVGTPVNAADENSGCDKFAWPIERDRALIAASDKLAAQSGTTFSKLPDTAFVVPLQSTDTVKFVQPPERMPSDSFGGLVSFEGLPQAGLYQVTLSEDAWVDVIQDGRYARSAGNTGRRDCPHVRKSLRFHLDQSPVVLQLSGAKSSNVTVTFRPVPAEK